MFRQASTTRTHCSLVCDNMKAAAQVVPDSSNWCGQIRTLPSLSAMIGTWVRARRVWAEWWEAKSPLDPL